MEEQNSFSLVSSSALKCIKFLQSPHTLWVHMTKWSMGANWRVAQLGCHLKISSTAISSFHAQSESDKTFGLEQKWGSKVLKRRWSLSHKSKKRRYWVSASPDQLLWLISFLKPDSIYLISWRRKWQPTPVLLPGESHGQRRLPGYSVWGRKSRTRLSD